MSQQAVCEHGTPGDRTALHKPGADPLLPAGALHRSPLPALSYVNHVTWYLYLDISVHLSFFLHGNNLMYVYLYILMHDHVYSTHHLFSSFSKELYRLAVKSLLFKLINNATYVYAIVILYDQSQIHLSRGRPGGYKWVGFLTRKYMRGCRLEI